MEKYEEIIKMMDALINDRTIPRNIRGAIDEAKNVLINSKDEEVVKISSAINILDEITNDPNMPLYARTRIWNIVSRLEEIRTKLEK
ncbi:MAG: hypothetical protein B6U78_02595 [Candidatus Aenigmarchaeota archaeon ex4484_224]|nr:MAG: hypothetical protein B6U78_02595 [Candidatus Aenigmarchaeota archaeon ex4484_224]